MRSALFAHDDVLRAAIEGHGGFLFKHTGDGVCAAFSSPKSAVDAAVGAQRRLRLPVRMGLATGEAELREGDYFGMVLNRAARVMAAGHGGQILLADTTAALLSGIDLLNLGPRRLRDIPSPITVFQLQAPGLSKEFPPLRNLDPAPGNLRPPTTSLIGRETELSDVRAALRSHRLVTLTGVGGVGKTRLALEVATQLADEFSDGVWVFELAVVADPAAVPDAVAAVLGIVQQAGKDVSESVASALEGRLRLLVFDNCEHVVDSVADLVDAILAASATVKVLATSREGIGVADERLWRVPPLDVGAAAELFVERARSVVSGSLAGETTAVEDVCRRLDGIPLAIELAASRMASMTAAEVRDRLDDRFKLLVGSRRGSERHQTLRHAVAWSYDLLDDAEKSLLQRCSVFSGGFDIESACAVVGSDDVDEYIILDRLDALVRKSLLIADRASERNRFSMLETIRQFAEEQLAASGDGEATRNAYARYFAEREGDVLALWDGPRQREAFVWLITELADLRTAFRWADAHDDLDTAAAIAVYAGFLGGWIEQHEPSTWAEELIDRARAVGHPRLGQLYVISAECYRTGRLDDGVEYADAGVAMLGTGHFDRMLYDIEPTALGGTYITVGSIDRWLELCRKRFALGEGMNAFNRGSMVMALTTAGELDEAKSASEDLLKAADATDNPGAQAFAMLAYGYAWRDASPTAAYEALRRGLTIAQTSGNRMIESYLAVNLSAFAAANCDPVDALDFLTLAIKNFFDTGSYSHMVSPLAVLATHFDRIGQYEAAATIAGFAVSAFALATFPEIDVTIAHLREVLSDNVYESLSEAGASMANAGAARYALDKINQARGELHAVSE
ncbi:MAG: Cyclase [Mycobacterium sp.]|jgi:predicted ATPase|uniref:ATP-binding protein n=1 Tax=Mycobacterium sp. TaxID=1785 RepID=UPI00345C5C2D|nr:Cyclase [Mycobacterium sp.]